MEASDSVSPVGSAAAVRPHPQSVTGHVHSGLLTLAGSSAVGPGNPHHLQVRRARPGGNKGERKKMKERNYTIKGVKDNEKMGKRTKKRGKLGRKKGNGERWE